MDRELTRRSVLAGGLALSLSGGAPAPEQTTAGNGKLPFTGVNLAGAEFGKIPGRHATDYAYPSSALIDYYAQLGFNLIRVPFRWERLQPRLGAPLAGDE
jgi:endoglucanase